MIGKLTLLVAFVSAMVRANVGIATSFDVAANDPSGNPNDTLACAPKVHLDDKMMVVASVSYPCWTRLVVCAPRTGLCTLAVVADRLGHGVNRYGLDLAPAVARKLKANGWERALWAPF